MGKRMNVMGFTSLEVRGAPLWTCLIDPLVTLSPSLIRYALHLWSFTTQAKDTALQLVTHSKTIDFPHIEYMDFIVFNERKRRD